MKVTLIGCGGWGAKIAPRLDARFSRVAFVDEVPCRARQFAAYGAWSEDPDGYLAVTGTQTSSTTPGAVVIATPPDTHLALVRKVLNGYGLPPAMLRIEKPLATTYLDAVEIVRLCEEAGTKLTVGFTLLHDPMYEAALGYLRAVGAKPERVYSLRIGQRARHRCDALLDQGIHGAAIAAYLDVPADVYAAHNDCARVRATRIQTQGDVVEIDEIARTVTSVVAGPIRVDPGGFDALTRDIDAWATGTHRGTPKLALEAQRIIDECLAAKAAA